MQRRTFLSFLSFTTVGIATFSRADLTENLKKNRPILTREKTILINLIDTLIPQDDLPSASKINIHEEIITQLQKTNNQFSRFLKQLNQLDQSANKLFSVVSTKISIRKRNAYINKVFQTQFPKNSYLFVHFINTQTIDLYYSSPLITPYFLGQTAPQPLGYPEHNKNINET